MYQLALDMSLVEFAVKAAIKDLTTGAKPLTADEIAAHIGCSAVTVRRTLPRLMAAKFIIRYGSKRNGYWYELAESARSCHA